MSPPKRRSYTQEEALAFHARRKPGKIEIRPPSRWRPSAIWPLLIPRAWLCPCAIIAERPDAAYDYTAKGNRVAVISNGTAILGSAISAHWPPSR